MPSWLITGGSRGVGLGLVQTLLKNESNIVVATARNPDVAELKELNRQYSSNRFLILRLDITKAEEVHKVVDDASRFLPDGLDYIVHNAGINPQPHSKFEELDLDLLQEELNFSTVAPLRLTRAFLPLTRKSKEKKIIFITSGLGSFVYSYAAVNQCNSYSVAKAAMNMVARKWGASLKDEGIMTATVHPGWVDTEIGAPIADWMGKNMPDTKALEPAESAAGIVKVAEGLTLENTASFWNYDGGAMEW